MRWAVLSKTRAPLVDWLCASITHQTANDVSTLEVAYPTVTLTDAALIDHCWQIVTQDLPGLDPDQQQNQGLQAVAAQIGMLAGEIHQGNANAQAACAAADTKTPPLAAAQCSTEPTTSYCTYYQNGHWNNVTPTDIISTLRLAVLFLGPQNLGFMPSNISAHSFCTSGAMALLRTS